MNGICAPSTPVIPLWPTPDRYQESMSMYGATNVQEALEFIQKVTHPRTGLAILLPSDDQSVSDVIAAAFSAMKREELNSEGFAEKVEEAISTCLYTFKLPVILNTDGGMSVFDEDDGTVFFRGSNWDMVQWVRERETVLIDPEIEPGAGLGPAPLPEDRP